VPDRTPSERELTEDRLGPPAIRRRLASLSSKPLNFDLAELERAQPGDGWKVTDACQPLPAERPGNPERGGSFEIAQGLMRSYEFADPRIVRAYYDPRRPLEGRDMLLELKALGLVHVFAGVRVGDVYEHIRRFRGREVRVWGWNYRTLEGHIEKGQMDWEVWKWLDSGEVEFRVHSLSRHGRITNPVLWLGYRLLRGHERGAFLGGTQRRMREFVELALTAGLMTDTPALGS
jgi:uncharacterized protein (UPF0548 family)